MTISIEQYHELVQSHLLPFNLDATDFEAEIIKSYMENLSSADCAMGIFSGELSWEHDMMK